MLDILAGIENAMLDLQARVLSDQNRTGPMPEHADHVLSLIGDIYDTVLDSDSWPEVLRKTCEYLHGVSGTLMSQDTIPGNAQFYFQWGNNPVFLKTYQETYVKLNPVLVPTLLMAKAGDVLSTVDLMPLDEFFSSRFYKEWVAPQGLIDSIFTMLEKSSTRYAFVAFTRHERHGLVDPEMRRRLKTLSPHLRRAIAISKIIDLHKLEAASLADTLDGIAAAMFLVDFHGRLVHANTAGHALLAHGSIARCSAGKLTFTELRAGRTIEHAFGRADNEKTGLAFTSTVLPLSTPDGERYVAHVLPLTSGARRNAGICYSAIAAIFVRKAEIDLPHPVEAIAQTFALTPAEMRVLMMIVQVGGVPEVAPALGISETTVKTHLQRIFVKTGTTRQTELVKLVAGYMSPLVSASLRDVDSSNRERR